MLNDPAPLAPEKAVVLIGYGLILLALCNGITGLIAAVIAYVRRDATRGSVWESHYRNIVTVFWAGLIFGLALLAAALSGMLAAIGLAIWPGWEDGGWIFSLPLLGAAVPLALMAGMMFGLWYLYRILRGLLHALDDKAY